MRPIVKWQREQLTKELLLLQGHGADPSCPCKSEGEACVRKHLLTIEALCDETLAIDQEHTEDYLDLSGAAREIREVEEKRLCRQDVPYPVNLAEWAREWRKKFEDANVCRIEKPKESKMHEDKATMHQSRFICDWGVEAVKQLHHVDLPTLPGNWGDGHPWVKAGRELRNGINDFTKAVNESCEIFREPDEEKENVMHQDDSFGKVAMQICPLCLVEREGTETKSKLPVCSAGRQEKLEDCILEVKAHNIKEGCCKPEGNGSPKCPNAFAVCQDAVGCRAGKGK